MLILTGFKNRLCHGPGERSAHRHGKPANEYKLKTEQWKMQNSKQEKVKAWSDCTANSGPFPNQYQHIYRYLTLQHKYIKWPIWQYQQISIHHITFSETSLLRQVVSNHRQINCMLNSLFRTTWRTKSKFRIIILLCVETTTDRWFPSQMGQLCCKCRHVPTSSWTL